MANHNQNLHFPSGFHLLTKEINFISYQYDLRHVSKMLTTPSLKTCKKKKKAKGKQLQFPVDVQYHGIIPHVDPCSLKKVQKWKSITPDIERSPYSEIPVG